MTPLEKYLSKKHDSRMTPRESLSLRKQFADDGYNVSCITSSNMGLLMGMHSYSNIFNEAWAEEEKILELNQLARKVICLERPRLLIVEAPDAMMKYNNAAPNGFGIRTYMVSQSLEPSLLVCSIPADLAVNEFVGLISQDFSNRYGLAITAIHVSNALIDSLSAVQDQVAT